MAESEKPSFTRATVLAGVPAIVADAIERWNQSAEASSEERAAILAAKEFRAGNQWPEDVRLQRQGAPSIQGMRSQPPRPCLTVDYISQPVRQVSNAVKQADFAFTVAPNGEGADQDVADILKGWLRRIQNEARAEAPIEWAADQAAEGGIGWFRIRTDYVTTDPDDPWWDDQDAKLERITNNLAVYADPASMKPMRSDGRFLLLTSDLPRSEFKRLYPKADWTTLDAFQATGDQSGWVTGETIRLAEYWYVDYEDTKVVRLTDGKTLSGADAKDAPKDKIQTTRTIRKPVVKWSKISATEELESGEWTGSRIPFIPIQGEELNVDGKIIRRGVIGPAMDAQRMVNYTYSGAVENAALAPKAPYVAAEGQLEGYKAIWQTANTFNYSALPYKPTTIEGMLVPPPQRQAIEPPIEAMVSLMRVSQDAVQATTETFDASLGKSQNANESGKKTLALQQASEFAKSGYMEQVQNALIYAGELLLEIAPKILDRPGRVLQILGQDAQPQQVMLGAPYVPGANGQAPQPAQPDHLQSGMAKLHDLKKGRYGVTVEVGKASATRREAGTQALGELIPHMPPMMAAAVTPQFIKGMDFPGAQAIADIAEKSLPPNLQSNASDPMPPQAQAQITALQGQLQQMGQELQKANAGIPAAQLKAQTDVQIAQLNNASREKIAAMQVQSQLVVTQRKIQADAAEASIEAETKRIAAVLDEKVGVAKMLHETAHDAASQQSAQQHETVQNLSQQAHERALAAQQAVHQQQAAEQQAALQPQPSQE